MDGHDVSNLLRQSQLVSGCGHSADKLLPCGSNEGKSWVASLQRHCGARIRSSGSQSERKPKGTEWTNAVINTRPKSRRVEHYLNSFLSCRGCDRDGEK